MKLRASAGFVLITIYSHLLAAIQCGKLPQAREPFFTPAQEEKIAAAFGKHPTQHLPTSAYCLAASTTLACYACFGPLLRVPERNR